MVTILSIFENQLWPDGQPLHSQAHQHGLEHESKIVKSMSNNMLKPFLTKDI